MTTFPRARTIRFNEVAPVGPGVGHYSVVNPYRMKGPASFVKANRWSSSTHSTVNAASSVSHCSSCQCSASAVNPNTHSMTSTNTFKHAESYCETNPPVTTSTPAPNVLAGRRSNPVSSLTAHPDLSCITVGGRSRGNVFDFSTNQQIPLTPAAVNDCVSCKTYDKLLKQEIIERRHLEDKVRMMVHESDFLEASLKTNFSSKIDFIESKNTEASQLANSLVDKLINVVNDDEFARNHANDDVEVPESSERRLTFVVQDEESFCGNSNFAPSDTQLISNSNCPITETQLTHDVLSTSGKQLFPENDHQDKVQRSEPSAVSVPSEKWISIEEYNAMKLELASLKEMLSLNENESRDSEDEEADGAIMDSSSRCLEEEGKAVTSSLKLLKEHFNISTSQVHSYKNSLNSMRNLNAELEIKVETLTQQKLDYERQIKDLLVELVEHNKEKQCLQDQIQDLLLDQSNFDNSKVMALEDNVSRVQTFIDDLKTKCDVLTQEKNALEQTVASAEKKLQDSLEDSTKTFNSRIEALQTEVAGHVERISELNEDLVVRNEEIESLKSTLDSFTEECRTLESSRKQELEDVLMKNDILNNEVNSLTEKFADSKFSLMAFQKIICDTASRFNLSIATPEEALKQVVFKLETSQENVNQLKNELQNVRDQTSSEMTSLETSKLELENRIEELSKQMLESTTNVGSLQETVIKLETEIDRLKKSSEQTLSQHEQELESALKAKEGLETQLEESKQELIDMAQQSLIEKQNLEKQLLEEKSHRADDKTGLEQIISELTNQVQDTKNELTTIQSDREVLQSRLKDYQLLVEEIKESHRQDLVLKTNELDDVRFKNEEINSAFLKLQQKFESLMETNDVAEKELCVLRNTDRCLKSELIELKTQINEISTENDLLRHEHENASEQLQSVKKQLEESSESAKMLRSQLNDVSLKLEQKTSELSAMKVTMETTESFLEQERLFNDDLAAKNDNLLTEVDKLTAENAKMIHSIENSKQHEKELESAMESLRDEVSVLKHELNNKTCELEEVTSSLSELQHEVNSQSMQDSGKDQEINELKAEIESLQLKFNSSTFQLEEENKKLCRKVLELRQLVRDYETTVGQYNDYENEYNQVLEENRDLKSKLDANFAVNEKQRSDIISLESRLASRESQLNVAYSTSSKNSAVVKDLEMKVTELFEENSSKLKQLKDKENDISKLNSKIKMLERDSEVAEEKLSFMHNFKSTLEKELQEKLDKTIALESDKENLSAKLEVKTRSYGDLFKKVQDLIRVITKLELVVSTNDLKENLKNAELHDVMRKLDVSVSSVAKFSENFESMKTSLMEKDELISELKTKLDNRLGGNMSFDGSFDSFELTEESRRMTIAPNKWQSLYEKTISEKEDLERKHEELSTRVEPFKDLLASYGDERDAMMTRHNISDEQYKELADKYAELLGHHNNKQKIKHMHKLKCDNLSLQKENSRLQDELRKMHSEIKSMVLQGENKFGKMITEDFSSSSASIMTLPDKKEVASSNSSMFLNSSSVLKENTDANCL